MAHDKTHDKNDYVKVYRERFWTLCTILKNIIKPLKSLCKVLKESKSCTGNCNQGRLPCDCK